MSAVRAAIAFALLAGMIYLVGAEELLDVLERVDFRYVLGLVGMSFVLISLSCIKWQLFIRAWGHEASLLELMRLYTITYFYNVFAPSFLMGDLARSYHLGKRLENQKDAFVTTFLERVTGLLAMVLLGTLFVAIGTTATQGVEAAILVVAFFVLLAALVCFSKAAFEFATGIALWILGAVRLTGLKVKCEKLFEEISKAVDIGRKNQALFFKAMAWSICFHFGTVVNTYIAARAIGWEDPDFAGLCIVVPLVLLVAIAPITPSGIGIQEGAFMFFLERIGATRPEALGVGLILRAKNLITAFAGWVLWMTLKNGKAAKGQQQAGVVVEAES